MLTIARSLRDRAADAYTEFAAHRLSSYNPRWNLDDAHADDWDVQWPAAYEWPAAGDWVGFLERGLKRHTRFRVVNDIPQPYRGTVIFRVSRLGEVRNVAVGYSDYPEIEPECAEQVDLYFKMQFARDGYGLDHIVPGGYVPGGRRLYRSLARVRAERDSLGYRSDVAGRFSLNYAPEIRSRAISLLQNQTSFVFAGGLKRQSYDNFLKEAAGSRICIDLPGLGDLCFRLIDYLAIGSCVVAYPHGCLLHEPLVDREHIVYCKDDLSDLVELCEYYLENDDERERIAANARRFFDANLHQDNLIRYYLHTCADRLYKSLV